MKIIFDFDGVICRTQEFWLEKMNEKYGTHYTLNDWTSYDIKENFKEDFEKMLQIAPDSDTSEAKAYDWTLRTIAQLQQYSDHEIIICSKTLSAERAEQKRKFLEKNRVHIPFVPIYEGDKDKMDCNMIIDDNPDVLLKSMANYKVLLGQP